MCKTCDKKLPILPYPPLWGPTALARTHRKTIVPGRRRRLLVIGYSTAITRRTHLSVLRFGHADSVFSCQRNASQTNGREVVGIRNALRISVVRHEISRTLQMRSRLEGRVFKPPHNFFLKRVLTYKPNRSVIIYSNYTYISFISVPTVKIHDICRSL